MQQNYGNHRRFVPLFHFVLFGLIVAVFIGAIVNLTKVSGAGLYSASLILAMAVAMLIQFFYTRVFALRAQDRAIRAEENLRHFAMTGKLLDPKLTMRQIIGLRFAGDDEFVALAERAVKENLSEDAIKKAVKNWRGDYHRA